MRYINRPEGNAQIISKSFEPQWHYDYGALESQVRKRLMDNQISFTNFYIKKGIDKVDEIIIACTDDDKTFTYFRYNTRTEGLGLLENDGISKPRTSNIAVN